MKHIVIMPEDCHIATEGRFKGLVVRVSSWGVQTPAGWEEVRYVTGLAPAAVEQANLLHTHNTELRPTASGRYEVVYVPKAQKFKMVEVA